MTRGLLAVGLAAAFAAGCTDPRKVEDIDRRMIDEVNALADALDKDDAADAAARLAALRELTTAAKRTRIAKADNDAVIEKLRGPLGAATDRLTKAAAAAKARGKVRLEDVAVPPP